MSMFEKFCSVLSIYLPALVTAAVVAGGLYIARWLLFQRRRDLTEENLFHGRIVMLLLTGLGVVLLLIALPLKESTENGLFKLLGLLLTAVIALSSTTFVANAMAGWMLRAVRSFKPGDFVRVGEHFGRVTGRKVFHTEIQIEDRDLTTLPNLYIISHPITVVRASGTIVSATVSLGYDNLHTVIEPLLIKAAGRAALEEPFVQILELGDFSVTYRVAGFLKDVKQILTARSNLRAMMLDTLHEAGIEIVSPTFMYQRRTDAEARIVPPKKRSYWQATISAKDNIPEELIFDKADQAERLEQLGAMRDKLAAEADKFESHLKKADEDERSQLQHKIERRRKRAEAISKIIETFQDDEDVPESNNHKPPEADAD